MNKITYHREGDYLVPDLYLPKQPEKSIGKYGRLRLNFIKEHKKGLYTKLLISGTLKQLAEQENVNENLKEHHQMEWVQAMNNIKNRAEEIVFNEILYV